ncbi:DNA-directed RNA polymerase [Trichostrongylus colubriformis]|uniref:DNA-directed RNA polymerase n=1 Tax=Trichostrongylus colubriformis TaxID=6319 RepID=A0AAN8IQV7_TRICO
MTIFQMLARRRVLRLLLLGTQKISEYRINSASLSTGSLKVVVNDRKYNVVKPKKDGWKSKKSGDAWRTALIADLEKELKAENRRFSTLQGSRAQHAQLIRYAISEDMPSVISIVYQRARLVNQRGRLSEEDDQFITFALTILQKSLLPVLKDEQKINASEMLSTFFTFANLWDQMIFYSNDMRISVALLYNIFDRWSQLRAPDESSDEIDEILAKFERRLRKLVKSISLEDTHLFLTHSEREQLSQLFVELDVNTSGRRILHDDTSYDKNSTLLDHLREPLPKESYHGNQYQLDDVSKESYVAKFPEHIATEKAPWLYVENYTGTTKKSSAASAESLLETWDWLGKIRCTIKQLLEDRPHNPLRLFLKVISIDEIAAMVMESLKAVCSQGQNLVPIGVFDYNLVTPIMRSVQAKFVEKLGIDEAKMWSSVFEDYVALFDDDEIARLHTHREWWIKCCRRAGVHPSYQIPFEDLHTEARQQIAHFLTEVVIDACKFPNVDNRGTRKMLDAFSLRNVAIEEESRVFEGGRITLSKMLAINSKLLALLDKHPFDFIVFSTHQLPMTVPPRPWCDGGLGGPEYTRRTQILRNLPEYKQIDINAQMKKRLKSQVQARPVFDALNQLGSTPWRINEPMLDVLCKVFGMSSDVSKAELLDILAVPLRSDTVDVPEYQEFFGEEIRAGVVDKEKYVNYSKRKAQAVKMRNELNSLWCWMKYRIVLARHFRGRTLFFPHNMDFRGRVYPISPYLSHMGDDVSRCLLKFAKGRALGDGGFLWLKLHCINLTGKMKRESIKDRLAAADQQLNDMVDSANHPLNGKGWWLQSEEPWQTLAACMEIRDALAFPGRIEDFVSHLAVHQDGSCNGLQHYAALGRDEEGGREVNLLESETPNDVYSSVATRVEQKRLEDEKGGPNMEIAQRLRKYMPQPVPRKVIKQTVMTTVYGVTLYGAALQIKRQLKAIDIDNEDTAKFAQYLTHKTFASLHDAFTCSMKLKDWFRDCAKGVSDLLRTMEWVTPLGLPVVQPYVIAKEKKGKVIHVPVSLKQVGAFPPNLVHSLDSCHMMLTSLECSRRGVTFAAVHDCFWTHASTVDEMGKLCREQFIKLHSEPIVQQCSDWFHSHYLTGPHIELMPPEDLAHFRKLFTCQVRPGDLDIKQVKDSVYFFS